MILNIIGTIAGISLIDRLGRKVLLSTGSVAMTVALVTAAAMLVAAGGKGVAGSAGVAVVVMCSLFIFAFAIGWGYVCHT